jgi:hypothetical protein
MLLALICLAALLSPGACAGEEQPTTLVDQVQFGSPASESSHRLEESGSEVVTGGLGQHARRLLPGADAGWQGGHVRVTVNLGPKRPLYATVRLWGSEGSPDRLFLFCNGRQIGYRHLGDIDILDVGAHEPPCNGRFYYVTTPLPEALPAGASGAQLEIRSSGPIWGYGDTFERYQKPMSEPTRGIYALYLHSTPCFVPPAEEAQGAMVAEPPLRTAPGAEVIEQVQARINHEIDSELAQGQPLGQIQLHFLARATAQPWTHAWRNSAAIDRIRAGVDHLFERYRADPAEVRSDKGVYNSEWFATGMAAEAVRLVAADLAAALDQPITPGGEARRGAWAVMFQDSRDHLRHHRRQYTNQSMIVDMNIYRCNRVLLAIAPAMALPEQQALRYLREAIGLDPWLGSDGEHGPEKPLGERYFQLTAKGLTRELGYVGYYGEVIDWVTAIYEATCAPGGEGDAQIKAQAALIANARAMFRYPMLDADGARAMRIEAVVGWRDDHYPGDVTYGERATWDASPLYAMAITRDPRLIGAAQQQLADHQLFAAIAASLKEGGLRTTAGLLGIPAQYQVLLAAPAQPYRLPMSSGQGDLVFADEEDGVVAIKHGDEILYASLYWRARFAINHLARIHHITPRFDRVAVVHQEELFEPSGATWKRPDWTDFGFANGGHRYPDEVHSAETGEELPIARFAADGGWKPGAEHPLAGRASFYQCRYGRYLIGMNATRDQTFALTVPKGVGAVQNLSAGGTLVEAEALNVAPGTTTVLLLAQER